MPAQLLSLSDTPDILLDKPVLLLGRHAECDIQLNSRKISRRHCCIAQVGNRLVIRDLGSTNGIRINGERILERDLHSGDEVTIGNFRFTVKEDEFGQAASPPPSVKAPRAAAQVAQPKDPCAGEDAMLEECDEPVPLDEPARASAPSPSAVDETSKPAASPNGAGADHAVLPDDLRLIPPSDVVPLAKSASGSQAAQD